MSVYDELDFAPMLITDVFTPHKGKRLVAAARRDGSTPFVGGSESFNSITGFSDVEALFPGGWLTLTYNGSVGHTKLQPAPFFASDDVIALEPIFKSATQEALLICASIITRECVSKYSYGVKLNLSRLAKQTIMVPVTRDSTGAQVVDWDGMTRLGRELMDTAIAHTHSARQADPDDAVLPLPNLRFEPILITDIFIMRRGKACEDPGGATSGIPYITASANNNSQVGFVNEEPTSPGGSLSISNTGSVGYCTFQPVPFFGSNNTTTLELHTGRLSEECGVFLASAITHQCFSKYSYGYIANMQRLSKQKIMVPVTTDPTSGEQVVDWEGMTQYGRILRARAEQELAVATDKLAAQT